MPKPNIYAELLNNAKSAKEFLELTRKGDPKNYVLNLERLQYFARYRWPFEEAQTPKYSRESFTNVPAACDEWVTTELLSGKDRPKCLVLIGPRELGKTSWAKSLGPHHHWRNKFTGDRVEGAKFAIMDDIDDYGPDTRALYKGLWGSQEEIGIKIKNGISGHVKWKWGIPTIWCWNFKPQPLWNETNYECQSSVIVNVVNKMY